MKLELSKTPNDRLSLLSGMIEQRGFCGYRRVFIKEEHEDTVHRFLYDHTDWAHRYMGDSGPYGKFIIKAKIDGKAHAISYERNETDGICGINVFRLSNR